LFWMNDEIELFHSWRVWSERFVIMMAAVVSRLITNESGISG